MIQRYHIKIGDRQTTVSLDNILSQLLAIKLNTTPVTDKASQASLKKRDKDYRN